jgi:hypothetical protein
MKAKVKFKNGWLLQVPKEGNSPMLFLEWLSYFPAATNKIHVAINDVENNFILIRINGDKKQYCEAAKYINDNQ